VYDAEGRPVRITRNGVVSTYIYSGNGERVFRVTGTVTNICHYDRSGRLLFETDKSGAVVANYIYCGKQVTAWGTASGGYRFLHTDRAGSTLALSDGAGTAVARYAYSPFGAVATNGAPGRNPFTFVGALGVMDEGGGLFFMKNRYYDGSTGKFLQRDPLGLEGGPNLYAYAGNNPVNRVDPDGKEGLIATIQAADQDIRAQLARSEAIGKMTPEQRLMALQDDGEQTVAFMGRTVARAGEIEYKVTMGALSQMNPIEDPVAAGVVGGLQNGVENLSGVTAAPQPQAPPGGTPPDGAPGSWAQPPGLAPPPPPAMSPPDPVETIYEDQ
jgi:RHS repeat-associated protein